MTIPIRFFRPRPQHAHTHREDEGNILIADAANEAVVYGAVGRIIVQVRRGNGTGGATALRGHGSG